MWTLEQLTKIANENYLSLYQTQRFVEFGKLWKDGKEPDREYLSEWAKRFGKECEYVLGDDRTRKLLIKVDGDRAPYICVKQYRRLQWDDASIGREVLSVAKLMDNKVME